MTEETTTNINYKEEMVTALNEFYKHYIVENVDQSIQVFQSFTYGEMVIATLLLLFVMLYAAKWIWEVLR